MGIASERECELVLEMVTEMVLERECELVLEYEWASVYVWLYSAFLER